MKKFTLCFLLIATPAYAQVADPIGQTEVDNVLADGTVQRVLTRTLPPLSAAEYTNQVAAAQKQIQNLNNQVAALSSQLKTMQATQAALPVLPEISPTMSLTPGR